MEYSSFTLLGVVLIVVLGVAFSIYSICKGCSGLQERGMTARSFFSPTTLIVQRLRTQNTTDPYTISGQTVQDKGPPLYEELFAPPPSYEESKQLKKLAQQKETAPAASEHVTITLHPPPTLSETKPDGQSSDKESATVEIAEKSPAESRVQETCPDTSGDRQSSQTVAVPLVSEAV